MLSKKEYHPSISFEFFPPKTPKGFENLVRRIKQDFLPLVPSYVSITYGAGGSTRDLTQNTILKIRQETKIPVVSHLTCVGAGREEILKILEEYDKAGIHDVFALRGDPPKGDTEFLPHPDGFEFAADLVAFIRERFPHFRIGVAGFPEGHPATPNRLLEMEYLKAKIDAGADYICTQLFFDNRDYHDFVERCELAGIDVPVIAGVMPLTNRLNMEKTAAMALGARIPASLLRAMARAESEAAAERVGIHWATTQVLDLLENQVDGVHLYTLNKSHACLEVFRNMGISSSADV